MKDFLEYKGQNNIFGSRDAIRKSFQLGIIEDGETWMKMLKSRNLTSHSYDEKIAKSIVLAIRDEYYSLFIKFDEKFNELSEE
jgi:nucleotidyltransferase substrate binding protein (TIGR01987 family)